ncbi:IS1634 family transposase [Flexivirga caeni]|uniref:IS1634 family transposase n=1 Tax=Flexivirga caeni TaxID=2294115 RepID=A0A3M9LTF3_9MICO|nr:IS1634 family transposase [Flexivirga caeni]RNI16522.1 IS1634 family transposase [Flexivirga caeni]
MVFVRKVKTASGATAVQIAERQAGRDRVLEHLGSAHTDAELAVLMQAARRKVFPGQGELDLSPSAVPAGHAVIAGKTSALLWQVLSTVYARLGFGTVGDEVFEQLVLARVVEPTSKADSLRVLDELGVPHASLRTVFRSLKRVQQQDYRSEIATRCFEYVTSAGDITLCLYDVTTLYFEAEKEDALRKVGYSKERRVDPQVVVGLLVDRHGFPLEIGCFEGNKAEKLTIVPIIEQFIERHQLADLVVVADAGMLSAANLTALDDAGLRFIVGSRSTKAPIDLESHFHWHGDAFIDGQVIDTITPRVSTVAARAVNDTKLKAEPVWDPGVHELSWRAVWAYSHKRAVRDRKTLGLQEDKARAIVAGDKAAHATRFVKASKDGKALDEDSLARAYRLVGLKGYVTNLPAETMPATEVISSYHDLWHVEQSFRMSKTDLAARPMFHHVRDSIEAHLTIVFTALAVSRYLQDATGLSIRRIVRILRPIQQIRVRIAGHELTAADPLTDQATEIITATGVTWPTH